MNNNCVLIVDDEIIIARDLERIVARLGSHKIHVATNPKKALLLAQNLQPVLTLMDVNLEADIDGIDLGAQIRRVCDSEIIYVTAHADDETLNRAKVENPLGFILKPFDDRQVAVVVDLALSKDRSTGTKSSHLIPTKQYEMLTHAEKRILTLIARSLTSDEVASALGVAKKTVENHRSNICKKLELQPAKNSLLRFALQHQEELLARNR